MLILSGVSINEVEMRAWQESVGGREWLQLSEPDAAGSTYSWDKELHF